MTVNLDRQNGIMAIAKEKDSRKRRPRNTQLTRVRIMEAAERLFADRGIDAVPLREISVAAGQGNSTAVQYHFGTKEQLVFDIFEYRSQEFEPQRASMLVKAGDAGRLSDAKILLQILCLPHLSIADENGAHPYSAFLAQYITRIRSTMTHPFDDPEVPMPALRTVHRLLRERLPFLPVSVQERRIGLCKLLFLNMLMRRDSGYPHFGDISELPAIVDDTLEQMAAALTVPYRPPVERLFEEYLSL